MRNSPVSNSAAAAPLRFVSWGPSDHVFMQRPVTLDFMVKHLSEVSHVDHLSTSWTRVEMIALVLRLAAESVADDLTGLDH